MKVELLYFDGCLHWRVLEKRFREALDLIDDPSTIEYLRVESQGEAERLRFAGSPSILLNGTDPFTSPTSAIGVSCRVYSTPDGPSGSPTLDQLVGALRAEAQRTEDPAITVERSRHPAMRRHPRCAVPPHPTGEVRHPGAGRRFGGAPSAIALTTRRACEDGARG